MIAGMIDRRRLVLQGGAGALLLSSPAAARAFLPPTSTVKVGLKVFIPSEAVRYAGYTYGGGTKATLDATLDLTKTGAASHSRTARAFGITNEYANASATPVGRQARLVLRARPGRAADRHRPCRGGRQRAQRDMGHARGGGTHATYLDVEGANPLATLGPPIDLEITVGVRRGTGGALEYRLAGKHDGFPNYELKINGTVVYRHDCVAGGQTPLALFAPMDITVDTGWRS